MEGGRPVIIPSAEGAGVASGKAFPSFVAFTKDGQRLVGEPARRQAPINSEGTIYAAKRKMGTSHKFSVFGKDFTPQQVSAFILQKIKADAEKYLGDKVEEAVITVPAYFNDNQRQATKDAGEIAGLKVLRIINEPTAACLAYGLDKAGKEQKIMVFDLGGGTLDVTILEMGWDEEHKAATFEVLSTSGDNHLGGTDMDNALIDHIIHEFKNESGIDLKNDKMAFQRLREAAEKSEGRVVEHGLDGYQSPVHHGGRGGPKHLTLTIDRAKLESLIAPLIERCRGPIVQAMKDASAKLSEPVKVAKIILVGGPTRMPIVQKFVETSGPVHRARHRPHGICRDGAAIQAGIIKGRPRRVLLLDVTPLSLGIEVEVASSHKLIERNTTIPTKKGQVYSTASDNQPAVTIRVCKANARWPMITRSWAVLIWWGSAGAARGAADRVTFDIDSNRIVHVTAKDKGTGKEQSIRITAPTKLSQADIDKMIKDAEQYAEEDKRKREEVELVNHANTLVYATEKSLKDYGDKVSAEDRAAIEREMNSLKEAIKNKNQAQIRQGMDSLQKAGHKLAEEVYKSTASQQAAGSGADAAQEGGASSQGSAEQKQKQSSGGKEDEVIDADFKASDEK